MSALKYNGIPVDIRVNVMINQLKSELEAANAKATKLQADIDALKKLYEKAIAASNGK